MQSSGFLDLKSLMALNQTCKAYAIDELSLILLIENEITRYHGVQTMEEAIDFWQEVCSDARLKQWLERDSRNDAKSIEITLNLISIALPYEVMLSKMLQSVPTQSQRLQLVSEKNARPLLNRAARGNVGSLKTILSIFPSPAERLNVVRMQDNNGWNLLHWAARSGHRESIQFILSLYPETERLQALGTQDKDTRIVLHHAAHSGNLESLKTVLALYPESERLQALNMATHYGSTVLHLVADSNNIESIKAERIKAVLSFFPESQRRQALNEQDMLGLNVLDFVDKETRNSIKEWLSQSESCRPGKKRSHDSALQDEEVHVDEQPDTKRQRSQ